MHSEGALLDRAVYGGSDFQIQPSLAPNDISLHSDETKAQTFESHLL